MAFHIGPYQVRNALHHGREASIYTAVHPGDGLPLLAKIPNSDRPSPAVCARLCNEAQILERLKGASRCRQLVAQEAYGTGTALFFAPTDGVTLADHLTQLKLPLDEFLRLAIQMSETVAAVHDQEIVHRDVCPENFIVSGTTGDVTLIDFDRATLSPRESVEVRSPGALEHDVFNVGHILSF